MTAIILPDHPICQTNPGGRSIEVVMTTWVSIDVAEETHCACALDAGGRILLSRAVPY